MDRIPARKPRVIRLMTRVHMTGPLKGRAKIAKDQRTLCRIVQIKAASEHNCQREMCMVLISEGEYYFELVSPESTFSLGHRVLPKPKKYHDGCLPVEARPLLRFFQP